jgi:uncharacterized protein YndB with AHSA1/START domain
VDGELEQVGGQWRLRFTRRLRHPVDRVWAALTEPEHLRAWFPDGIDGEWRVGATLTFGSAAVGTFTGEVRAVDPPTALEFSWGTDLLRFELAAVDDGCVLTLLDTLDEVGKAARDGAGWHVCLDNLGHHLDGTTAPVDGGARWQELNPGYADKFGPHAATIGPPEGWDG